MDPVLRQQVDRLVEDAYARGLADGRTEGRAEALTARDAAVSALAGACAQTLAEARQLRVAHAGDVTSLAAEIARFVLGREPHDGGQALLARIREALADIDDAPITVQASTTDVALLTTALADVHDLSVVAAADLAPGEARLVGRWASAQITHASCWDRLAEVLDADA